MGLTSNKYFKTGLKSGLVGASLGGLSGGYVGADQQRFENTKSKDKKSVWKASLKGAAIGAGIGGVGAAAAGAGAHMYRDVLSRQHYNHQWEDAFGGGYQRRGHGGGSSRGKGHFHTTPDHVRPHLNTVGLSGNEKTKFEIQKKFREQARKHHPDMGGNPNKMKEINNAMDEIKQSAWFNKLASAFALGFSKNAKSKPVDESGNPALRFGVGAAGGFAAGQVSGIAALAKSHKNHKETEEIFQKIKKDRGLDVRGKASGAISHKHEFVQRAGSAWQPNLGDMKHKHGTVHVHPSAGPAIMAHEMGHAHHLGRKTKEQLLRRVALNRASPLLGVGAGIGMMSSDNEKVRKYAPAAILAGGAPTLYQEGSASVHAIRDLHKHMGRKAAIKGAGKLGLAFGSYALPFVGASAGAHWANKAMKKKQEK